MVDIRIKEIAHCKQDISLKKKWNDIKLLIKNRFDYDKMYDTQWTIEYEAHHLLKQEIINEFLEIYASKIDITNEDQVKRANYWFQKYTYTNSHPDTTNTNLKLLLEKDNEKSLEQMKYRWNENNHR